MNHTPGPWEITSSHDTTACSSIKGPKDAQGYQDLVAEIIKTGFPRRKDEGFGNPHWLQDNNLAKETTLANARLIAAAPDLLEALKEVLKGMEAAYTEGCSEVPPNIDWFDYSSVTQAYTAIAKATGGNHAQKS